MAATIDANPSTTRNGQDTFTSQSAGSKEQWNVNPTALPTGYTYKLHSQSGNGPITPTDLSQGVSVQPGGAASSLTAYMTYKKDGTTDEIQFTHSVPATTGASVIGWTPGEGQAGAPQPTLTITIVPGLGGDI